MPRQYLTHGTQGHMKKTFRAVICPVFEESERNILAGEAFAFCFCRGKSAIDWTGEGAIEVKFGAGRS